MPDLAMFSLSEEHKMIRDAARDFAQNEIVPMAAEFDESGEFPHATIKKMGGMGFMGIEVPRNMAGQAWIPCLCSGAGGDLQSGRLPWRDHVCQQFPVLSWHYEVWERGAEAEICHARSLRDRPSAPTR